MIEMFEKVVVAGTFNRIHEGHILILKTAFSIGKFVYIGLTSDRFANIFRAEKVLSYEIRQGNLKKEIEKLNLHKNYEIVKIEDVYGFATIREDLDAIVVSKETFTRAEEINAIRFKKGLKRLVIVIVPFVFRNNKPISSSNMGP